MKMSHPLRIDHENLKLTLPLYFLEIYLYTYIIEGHCLYNNLILTLLHILNKNKNDTSLF